MLKAASRMKTSVINDQPGQFPLRRKVSYSALLKSGTSIWGQVLSCCDCEFDSD